MATTVKQFIDRSVPLEPVKNKIDKEFATAIQQKYMYFDPERSAPKGPSQDLVYFVDQKKWQPRVDVQVDILKLFGNYTQISKLIFQKNRLLHYKLNKQCHYRGFIP